MSSSFLILRSSYLADTHDFLEFRYIFEIFANDFQILGIMYAQFHFTFENAVFTFYVQSFYIDIQLLGQHVCNLVQYTGMIDTAELYGGREE